MSRNAQTTHSRKLRADGASARQAKAAADGRLLRVELTAQARDALAELVERTGGTRTSAVNALLEGREKISG